MSKRRKGEIRIEQFSSLRKLMRAARRGQIPSERLVVIQAAVRRALQRSLKYRNYNATVRV